MTLLSRIRELAGEGKVHCYEAETMTAEKTVELIREGEFLAEVDVDLRDEAGFSSSRAAFRPGEPELLIAALKAHYSDNTSATRTPDRFGGVRITVDAPMLVPDGRRPRVRSVWKVDPGDERPRLITAYPVD